jgi:serine/threonine-protein kinase
MSPDPLHGTKYRTLRTLAQGGMGHVVLAEDTGLGRQVVVKVMSFAGEDNLATEELERVRDRFRTEARVLAMFDDHPGIVTVKDYGTTASGKPFIALEHLKGVSLGQEARARKTLPPDEAVQIVIAALLALQAVHDKGLVHRDLKPDNIFLCDGAWRTVKLIDFGVAKLLSEPAKEHVAPSYLTRQGSLIGTLRYAAPEQLCGQAVDTRTDTYAMAVVLYVLVAGHTPFENAGNNPTKQFRTMRDQAPPPPSRWNQQPIPDQLDRLLVQALAFEPAERFQSAADFVRALRDVLPACASTSAPLEDPTLEVGPPSPAALVQPAQPAQESAARVDVDVVTLDEIAADAPELPGDPTIVDRTETLGLPRRTLAAVTFGTAIVLAGVLLAAAHAWGAL